MKKDIHPKYNKVAVIFPTGEKVDIMSTYGKSDKIHAELYFTKHPAWSGGRTEANAHASSIADFNKKFGGLLDGMKNAPASTVNEVKDKPEDHTASK